MDLAIFAQIVFLDYKYSHLQNRRQRLSSHIKDLNFLVRWRIEPNRRLSAADVDTDVFNVILYCAHNKIAIGKKKFMCALDANLSTVHGNTVSNTT